VTHESFTSEHYYVRDRGHVQGPFDIVELRRRIVARRITRQHQVSTDKVVWQKLGATLPDLFPMASGPNVDHVRPVGEPVEFDDPRDSDVDRAINVIDDDFGQTKQGTAGGRAVAVAVTALAVIAPLAIVGWLAMMIVSPSTGDRAVANVVRPSLTHIQGIHPEHGKKRCLGLIVSRSLCIAPLMAATLDGVKIEARHKDGHSEWHSSRLQTADPVTGLCVLRADFGSGVAVIDLPETNRLPERRAVMRLLTPDEDSSCHVEAGTLKTVLNEGGPDEMLQIHSDNDSNDDDSPLGRAMVDRDGLLAGMVVGRLPSGESLCVPVHELRSKKKEAAKLPADHKLDRIDLPFAAFPPGGAIGAPTGAVSPKAEPQPPSPQEPVKAPGAGSEPDANRTPAAADADNAAAQDGIHRGGKDDSSGTPSRSPSAPAQRRADSDHKRKKKSSTGSGLPTVLRTATGIVNDAAGAVVPLPELPPAKARELGEEQLAEVCRRHRRARDRDLQRQIRQIAEEVLLAADRRPDEYTVTVVEDPDIQAYAFVGGNVVVNTGFIDFAAGDNEMIRFVMSHEIGHLVLGHVDMPFRRNLMAGEFAPGVPLVGEQINAAIKNSPFNQAEEEEADCFAVDIHRKRRWPIRGGIRFFKKIRDLEDKPEGDAEVQGVIDSMFSSHPDHERRIDLLNNGCDG
jgi:hypothetical protein